MTRMTSQQREQKKNSTILISELQQIKLEKFKNICEIIVPYFKWIFFISKVYIIWIVIHYVSVQVYVKYCVPSSIWGFIMSPLLVSSPHCKAMRWILHNGANTIDNMWNTIGVWFSAKLLQIN